MEPARTRAFWTNGRLASALGVLAALAVVLTLNDPGLTVDEPLDVAPGRKYVETWLSQGWRFFRPDVVQHVYFDNKEHPPLGRWLLGIASILGQPFEVLWLGPDPIRLYVRSGRLAPAACFGVLVALVTLSAGRRYGRGAGGGAGFALAIMPRVFAHAHIAALDTFITLFWTAALLQSWKALESSRLSRNMAIAGLVWGLALLTKIHAWLLGPFLAVCALIRLPIRKAIPALLVWGLCGLALFALGWPWLWYDPIPRLSAYFRTGVDRTPIYAAYFGQVYKDVDVPWHYPWIYFMATVPLGLHLLGLVGLIRGWRERRIDRFPWMLVGAMGLFLVLFSTNAPVYDGERLFLPVFPLWAILVGLGFDTLWRLATPRRWRIGVLLAFLLAQGYGVLAIHPFGLSYYNLLVGGLPGAERLGLELTYWGDAVDPVLLDRLARAARPGDSAALAPTLAPSQGVVATSRNLARTSVILQDEQAVGQSEWVVVYRRWAYWNEDVRQIVQTPPLFLRTRQGVWLSGLWHRPPGKSFRTN